MGRNKKRETMQQLSLDEYRESIGAREYLSDGDLKELSAGVRRVYALMVDGEWHDRGEIELAAGSGGIPAAEGLRRMRELRKLPGIEIEMRQIQALRGHKRRFFEYRMVQGG